MIEATSCGGVVIFRGKILLLYKNIKNKYEGWVLPKGTVEAGETHEETALREVLEESGSKAYIVDYIGRSEYSFTVPEDVVEKEVHWYLMGTDSYYSKPQREEYFVDSGFYKYHEANLPMKSRFWKKPMRIIRKEKGIINGKIDYSCFSEIFLNILDDFQIWSLQEIYKFVFIIF